MSETKIKKGDVLELSVESLAFGGRGVAKVNGYVIFVDGAVPGQRVTARIVRRKKDFAEARLVAILQPSAEAAEPKCPHFGVCGGCRLQNLSYEAQQRYKTAQVAEILQHLGGFEHPPVSEMRVAPEPFYYRNKMEFSFGRRRWLTSAELNQGVLQKPKDFALGLHIRGRFDRILDLDTCLLQSEESAAVMNAVREYAVGSGLPAYSTADHRGFWRHLIIRDGKNTSDFMVNIVTGEDSENPQVTETLATELTARFPFITTIVHNINRKKAQVATGDEERVLFGPGYIQEKIGHCTFRISANSFFQTNTHGAEILYDLVRDFAEFRGDEVVYDLYSGAGTISLFIAEQVGRVVGFEMVASAVADARANCRLNGIGNCEFVAGDLKDTLCGTSAVGTDNLEPQVIIIDPPRAGMHPKVVQRVVALRAKKLIYISCNPTTFARDARQLCDRGYALRRVQPVDMFPMTAHIELVSIFERASSETA